MNKKAISQKKMDNSFELELQNVGCTCGHNYIKVFKFIHHQGNINTNQNYTQRTSLVVQWLKIHLPVRDHGFDPWSRKMPHVTEHLSPCTTTTEACMPQSLCSAAREAAAMRSTGTVMESSPCSLQLEKAASATKTQRSQK